MDRKEVAHAMVLRAHRKARLRRQALYSPYAPSRVVRWVPTTDSPQYPTQAWFPNLGPASPHQYFKNERSIESEHYDIRQTSSPQIIYDPGGGAPEFDPSRQEREVSMGQDGKPMSTRYPGDPTNPELFKEEFPSIRTYRKKKDEESDVSKSD